MSKMYDPNTAVAVRFEAPELKSRGLWSSIALRLSALWRDIQARHHSQILSSFDERARADLGLSRGSIDHAVRYGRRLPDPEAQPPSRSTVRRTRPAVLPASVWTEWR